MEDGVGEGEGEAKVVGSARRARVSVKSGGRTSETNQGMSFGLQIAGISVREKEAR